MRSTPILRAAVLAALAALALAACDRGASGTSQRDGQSVGQKIDKALERTQEKLAAAGEKAERKLAEAGDKTKQTLSQAGDKIAASSDRAAANVGEAVSGSGTSGARTTMSDAAITASIKTDFLKDPDLSVLKIDVDTTNGVVTLNGLAGNEAARERAAKMAGAVKGVREVKNYLTVKRT